MEIFLTGGTGFVGTHVTEALLNDGHDVTLLVRPGSKDNLKDSHHNCNILTGDVLDKNLVARGCANSDIVINLVGAIREHKPGDFERLHVQATYNVVRGAQDADARIMQMSALGAPSEANAYYSSKYQGETLVQGSGQDSTVLRPSIIFGPGDDAISRIQEQANDTVVPVIGGGQRWQPIHVKDVAHAVTELLDCEHDIVRMGGPDVLTYNEIVHTVNEAAWTLQIPAWTLRPWTYLFRYQDWFPLGPAMLDLLLHDNMVEEENVDDIIDMELTALQDYLGR